MPINESKQENDHKGHRRRTMDCFLAQGLDGVPAHSVLELLLFFAIPRWNTNTMSHRLIERFGSLSGVMDAPFEELLKVNGIGYQSAVLIKLVVALGRLYLEDKQSVGVVFNTPAEIGAYMKPKFVGRTRETVFLLCFDKKNKLLKCELISEGTLDYAPIMIRRIVESVVQVGAASVVMVHNHPQGFALPSTDDVNATRYIQEALDLLSIRLTDHIIVARDDFVSMAESGILVRRIST